MSEDEWIRNTEENEPAHDGRYAVIYFQRGLVRRFVADYSVVDGWLSMMDAMVLAWKPMPPIPDWVRTEMEEQTA